MSIGTYPTPFSSTAPIPLQPVQDVRDQLWSYCLQRSLETNWSSPPFIHQPYYLPFSALDAGFTAPPFLISALHYFEWRSEVHHYPLIIVQIHISPAFSFNTPVVHIVCSPQYSCPSIHILWWDLPTTLPLIALDYLQEYDSLSSENVDLFISQLDDFHTRYFGPITPYNWVTFALLAPSPFPTCEPCGSSSVSGMTVGVPSHVRSGESEVNTRGELFEKAALFAIYLVPLI